MAAEAAALPAPVAPTSAPRPLHAVRIAAAVLCCFLGSDCNVKDPTFSADELPEQLGTALAGTEDVSFNATLLWAPDAGEVYFQASDSSVRAASSPSGTRVVDGPRDHEDLSAAGMGGAVYFVERQDGHNVAYRAAGGTLTVLTDRAPATKPLGTVDGKLVLGGPNDLVAGYIVQPDSLFIFNVASATRRFVATGCVRVVVFAPNAATLICRKDGPRDGGYAMVDLSTGQLSAVAITPPEINSTPLIVHWDEGGIHVLYVATGRFRQRDLTTGTASTVWAPQPTVLMRQPDYANWSWSGDSRSFVIWVHECLKVNRGGQCIFGQSVLHHVDLVTRVETVVGVVKGTEGGEQLALSRTGEFVAYVFDGRIYIQSIL